jgi:hypothetical protein
LDEGLEEALAKGGPGMPGVRTVGMTPADAATEGVEEQQADKQREHDQSEIEERRGIAEKLV